MSCPLRILHLENDLADAQLVQETLEAEGIACDITCVETQSAFVAALQQGGFDAILADWTLPAFDGMSALKIALQLRPDLPFIFVSGTIGEEVAVDALKIGATDYVLKSRLSRLAPAVRRAQREAVERDARKRAQEAARRSESELRGVINAIPAQVWSTSPEGAIDFVNQRWQKVTGLPVGDALGWKWESVVHVEDRSRFVDEWRAALRDGESMESEVRVRQADGEYRWYFVRNVPLRDELGNIVKWYGTAIDIEDRKRAEEERERLRQLEADLAHMNRVGMMGELAASLAHEIKQPMAAAATNAQTCLRLLERDAPDVAEARGAATRMVDNVKRAADIIDRNRSLYRRGTPQRELVDLNQIIREMVLLLNDRANENSIAIRTELAETSPKAMADRVQVQQVLMNLMLNGIDAMKDTGGGLTISSATGDDGQSLISVSDSGVGLPAEQSERIFDPFFTTKPQGTGMGLSISRTIVESHGGRLWANANSGPGATFYFTLPTATQNLNVCATGTESQSMGLG